MLAQHDAYFVCQRVSGCNKGLRWSERQFRRGPFSLPWCNDLEPEAAGGLVNVPLKASQARMESIERFANGLDLSSCASAAVSKETKTIAWYVHATFDSDQSNVIITHCKVDRAHPGKGLGGLLLEATEANVGIDKCIASFTATLVVLETNAAARKCNEKAGFNEYGRSNSAFSPIVCPQKIQWLGMSGADRKSVV